MTQSSLTLLLPELARQLMAENPLPPLLALQTLLSKGQRESLADSPNETLFDLFLLSHDAAAELPVAPLCALGDALEVADGWWLRADPVHLVADRDQLYLSASAALGVTDEEATALVTELNRLYAEDGWRFVAVASQRWYLHLPEPLAMRTTPTAAAMGRRVGEVLPRGSDALRWQRVMTEIQMVLHGSPVNQQRSEEGRLTVNSLWFWGGGVLPVAQVAAPWSRVVADDPLLLGLARLHGIEVESPMGSTLARRAPLAGRLLWQSAISSLELSESEYFAPLLAMLQRGELDELVILLPGLGRWRIDRAALRRWWRWRKPLATLLQGGT